MRANPYKKIHKGSDAAGAGWVAVTQLGSLVLAGTCTFH